MTTVDKLLVQGIRSFGPHKRNVIDFYTPLTLIVGQNGAGKTVSTVMCGYIFHLIFNKPLLFFFSFFDL
jgi:hypothetical protein